MQFFPQTETTFLLPGPAGNLEVIATPAKGDAHATAIICHPHSLHGGTMNNKVVTTLARAFYDLGLRTVRFNFRGVGKSVGKYSDGVGELEDLFAVVKWVKESCAKDKLWLAGFSFGAYVAACAATKIKIAQLVTVAPPVVHFNITTLPPILCPWIVVQGEQDEIVPSDQVFDWVDSLNPKPTLIRMQDTGHFFHGKLVELRNRLEQALA